MVLWIKALHIVAVISWMAGLLYLPRLFVYHCEAEPGSKQSETFKVMERRLLRAIMNPAMTVVWLTGPYLAWALDDRNQPIYPAAPGGERQREMAFRTGVNIVMYALTGNYKADQVHVPALLERLGQ